MKNQVIKLREGVYQLPIVTDGMKVPVTIFMTENLLNRVEDSMWPQMVNAASLEGVDWAGISADGHMGYSVPIGCIVSSKTHLFPSAAGYDINCGMMLLSTNLHVSQIASKEKRRALINAICERVPTGMGTYRADLQRTFPSHEIDEMIHFGARAIEGCDAKYHERCFLPITSSAFTPKRSQEAKNAVASLGGGNHFIELQVAIDGSVYIMLHTGSRGFGWNIADHFFKMAKTLGVDKDLLAFPFDSELGQSYWNLHNMAGNFAIANRTLIGQAITEAVQAMFPNTEVEPVYEISHNLVQEEFGHFVHRKGATRAFPASLMAGTEWAQTGHPIIIPGSMAVGAAVLYPLEGAKESHYSINHGAGRVLGRKEAGRRFKQSDVNSWMNDIVQTFDGVSVESILVNSRNVPIDESRECYKNLDEILDAVQVAGLAEVKLRLYPVAVIKGED